MGFPTKNDHFGGFWGYHHLRKYPDSDSQKGVQKLPVGGEGSKNHCPFLSGLFARLNSSFELVLSI